MQPLCLIISLFPILLEARVKFCIRPEVVSIFSRRLTCLHEKSTKKELEYLKFTIASEYMRAHELVAYNFFVEQPFNPLRAPNCFESDVLFEYIPLLPLSWIANNTTINKCSYNGLIEDVLAYISLDSANGKSNTQKNLTKFTVTSTYNLRTQIGRGLPSQTRSGEFLQPSRGCDNSCKPLILLRE